MTPMTDNALRNKKGVDMNKKIFDKVYKKLEDHLAAQNLRKWHEQDFRWLIEWVVNETIKILKENKNG